MDHRRHVRFPVQFKSSFSSANVIIGQGLLNDLSLMGCRVFSPTEVKSGTMLQVQIDISDGGPSIEIEQAVVRWVRGKSFGCEFKALNPQGWVRLKQVIKTLEMEPYQRDQDGVDAA